MAQKFLSIKNFERYQHYNQRNPPWIKLYKSLLTDLAFMKLDIHSRYLYVGLLIIASETDNRVPNDPSYLAHRLVIDASHIDLKPLYRGGFLLASAASIRRYHQTESETETESETDIPVVPLQGTTTTKVSKRGTVYPDGFEPDERAQMLAVSTGLNPHKELAAFRDHHTAKGTVFKDWQAAFRNWLRNALKYNQRGARA